MKPLGRKNYGSIGHLPSSRLGPGDHCVTEGQARIACERKRDKHDTIIVQEKLDGSNVGVCKVGGKILAMTRAGYLASTSPFEQHHRFGDWVASNEGRFSDLLREGERVCGEWLLLAHGTIYQLWHEPFVAFDLMTGSDRLPYAQFIERIDGQFVTPHVVSIGDPVSVADALAALGPHGFHGAQDDIEGAVWRVERNGAVDFLTKYVKPDKQDGRYFKEFTGRDIWNESPEMRFVA